MQDKKPECRMDEFLLSMEKLGEVAKQSGGAMDRVVETNWLLRELNVSAALLVDIMGVMYNRLVGAEKPVPPAQ